MLEHNSESRSDESLTIMGRSIPPEHLKPLLRFYEADHQLTSNERARLAEDLVMARRTLISSGMVFSTMTLFIPSMAKHYRENGFTLPGRRPATRLPFFYKPFWSAALAAGAYFFSVYFTGKATVDSKILQLNSKLCDSLMDDEQKQSTSRILNVWKSLNVEKLPLFAFYYEDTVLHPDHIMKDPRELALKEPTIYQRSKDGYLETDIPNSNSWVAIRQQHGFEEKRLVPSQYGNPKHDHLHPFGESDGKNPFFVDRSDLFRQVEGDSPKQESLPVSAWDRVRKRK